RWDSKELGWVMPYKFIQVAEESHMIIPIGKWVLETACKFIKNIHALGHKEYTIAVNISLLQVLQEDFVEMVLGVLNKYDLDPQYLELEMTETMLIKNFKLIVDKLGVLKEKGVKVALDDFGTGYSSLNYLNTLPLSTLKIDKSFVDTICTQPEHKVILSIIINLGQEIGLKVLAEGVETEEQYAYLHESGCDSLQGYLLSKPVAEDEILEMLKR
ncbi:MAG TPA: EAL domain-containing protein, partial [Epulopiscium sp.]|nr:EAL domain-containing protein [Candidatus Epulonipiscium sp.]